MTQESPEQRADGRKPNVERGGLWGLFFSAAGLLIPPYGIIFSAFGIVQGIRARRAAKAGNGSAPGAVLSVVVGGAGVLLSALMAVFLYVYWDEYSDYRECSARAHTVSAQRDCDESWQQTLSERTGVPAENIPTL